METRDNTVNNNVNNNMETPEYERLATLASRLLLFSSIISNTTDEPSYLIGASIIGLYAGILLVKSAILEAEAQQVAPGETTFANKLKLIGTSGNLACSFILYIALLIETYLGTPPTGAAQTPAAGTVGALFV